MAVVVDEKWNQTGRITFEDLLEEIFGITERLKRKPKRKAEG